MSIAFLNYSTETFSPVCGGSLSTYIWELCQCAKREGIEPTVLTMSHDAPKYDWPRTVYVSPPELPSNPWLFRWERVKRKISQWPHLRHEVYARRVADSIEAGNLGDSPLVLQNDVELAIYLRKRFPRLHMVLLFQNYHRIKRFFPGELKDSVNVVAAVSRALGEWVEGAYGLAAGSVVTVYNGVNLERFAPAATLAPGAAVINFTGRVCREKAPDTLLRAALKVARKRRDFSLQILGWRDVATDSQTAFDREMETLRHELERLGVNVRKGGLVERARLPMELHKASIHVTPSRWEEPCAFVNLEGMASGLAVIGSRTGGTPEVIGGAGLLFERDNIDELADQLERLIADPSVRRELSQRGRARAGEFSWDRTWRKIHELGRATSGGGRSAIKPPATMMERMATGQDADRVAV
ncbi:MAG TPA: glycosyltransferase family 4 protein [Tepidisphaeraceae bacterium]|jgi:glycosyltransferase involved in cell wall biosynthesis|nr:glycosyltransferase family 4 protein [Tepidisphaeraceae bacterium]